MEIRWMDGSGDSKTLVNPKNEEQMEKAQEMIEKAFAEGRGVFALDSGNVGQRLHAFDPKAKTIVVTPPIVGG